MQIQEIEGLSVKSRGILYHFKRSLELNKINYESHICAIFQFRKQKFKKKQFTQIIKKFDENLCLSDIDRLFDELDENKNGFVFYEVLQNVLKSINEQDNPKQHLNRMSKIKMKTEEDVEEYEILIQIKDFLTKTQYYREIIEMFGTQDSGYLTKHNFEQLLQNFGYQDPKKKSQAIQIFYSSKNKVAISDILQKLGLEEDAMRLSIDPNQQKPLQLKLNQQELKQQESQYIRLQKQSKINNQSQKMNQSKFNQTQKSFKFFVPEHTDGILKIQDVPQELQHYYNYGSEMEEQFAIIAADYLRNKAIFIDTDNPTFSKAFGFVHIEEINPHYQLFNKARSVVNRKRKGLGEFLQPRSIVQGSLGDCYFLSALAAIVQDYPELVYRLFVLQKNPSHIFGVRLFIEGVWKTIILDGILPINRYGSLCGAQPHQNQIWVILLQKAWAKEFGAYDNIHSGYNEEGLVAISGAPTIIVSSRQAGALKRIEVQFKKGSIITCSTSRDIHQLTQKQQQEIGIFASHAYTILKTYIDIPYKNGFITLLKVRNPWGKKAWKKDWSYSSSKWTKELREKLNFVNNPNDGTFFISYDDFVMYFDNINISKVNLGNVHTCVSNEGNRYEFYENRFTVKNKGDYFFTIYQANPRRYKKTGVNISKSNSYLFLAKIQKQTQFGLITKLQAIACSAALKKDNTLETTLQPGHYILLSNVTWNYHNSNPYNITVYGPGKIALNQGVISTPDMIKQIIDSRYEELSKHGALNLAYYERYQISKTIYSSIPQGIGFLAIKNSDKVMLTTQINFSPCVGLLFLPPYNLPLNLNVLPHETIICAFIVSPEGYNYRSKQKYYINRM